ncbi:ZDHHC2, partial [Symbiodinium microadriaticum]
HRVAGCPVFIDALAAKDSRDTVRLAFERTISRDRVWQQAVAASNIDIRFSSHQHDCYLGTLAHVFCQHLNGMAASDEDGDKGSEEWMQHYLKLNLELEAVMFHMELPWSLFIRSRFRFGPLLTRLSRFVKEAGKGQPSRCDEHDWPEDTELLTHADESGLLPVSIAEMFMSEHGRPKAWEGHGADFHGRCPFSVAAAALSLTIWIQVGQAKVIHGQIGRAVESILDLYMVPMMRVWEAQTTQFFYDVFSSHWRLWDLLEVLDNNAWITQQKAENDGQQRLEVPVAPKRRRRVLRPAWAREAQGGPPQVLLLGGGPTTYRWTSFTQRGRQLARGLRHLGARGADARTWNGSCRSWCWQIGRMSLPGTWVPDAIIHIKYMCSCAISRWRQAVHVYDPVDIDGWSMGLRLGDPLLRFDAILATTSLGVSDLRQHPSLQAVAKNLSIFWLPIHHSNFHDLRSRDPTAEVHVVGTHTVHRDPPLYAQLQRTVREVTAGRARFVHLNPAKSFAATEGRIITPRQIDDLYQEISSLDVAICKMSGCQSNWWFCSRWRTGQRLVNLLSLGIPTVVWGDARGNMDVLEGRWPPSDLFGDGSEFGTLPLQYPPELVIRGDGDALGALRLVLQNATLRALAREQGLQLAKRFTLQKISSRDAALPLSLPQFCRTSPNPALAAATAAGKKALALCKKEPMRQNLETASRGELRAQGRAAAIGRASESGSFHQHKKASTLSAICWGSLDRARRCSVPLSACGGFDRLAVWVPEDVVDGLTVEKMSKESTSAGDVCIKRLVACWTVATMRPRHDWPRAAANTAWQSLWGRQNKVVVRKSRASLGGAAMEEDGLLSSTGAAGSPKRARFDEKLKFLPVAYVVVAMLLLAGIYLQYHISPLLSHTAAHLQMPDAAAAGEIRGLIQLSLFVPVTALLLICYVRSILTHPGEIPDDPKWEYMPRDKLVALAPLSLQETKKSGERRHCKWCGKYKPDRCHHCRVCRTCILKMDHHCPWIYNCVGCFNYKFFILLLFYSALDCHLILWSMSESVLRCVNIEDTPFKEMFMILFGECLALILALLVTAFLAMHLWLISKGLTTIEFCEKSLPKDGQPAERSLTSVYDLGLYGNFCTVLGSSVSIWLLPIGMPDGDGITFVCDETCLTKDMEAASGIRRKTHQIAQRQRPTSYGSDESATRRMGMSFTVPVP